MRPTNPRAESRNPVSRKVNSEVVLLLGWGRSLLLQFAHPGVAQGIVDHSGFLRDRRGRWHRLRRTLDAMLAFTYGPAEEVERVARGINAIHDRVHGWRAAGDGTVAYSAHDPELLRWVHATLVESFLLAYELFVEPLSPAEKERYCAETAGLEPWLGIPTGFLPRTIEELERYMDGMLAGPDLEVSDAARRLAGELFAPVPRVAWPLMALARLSAVGLLPSRLRGEYGFAWPARNDTALRVLAGATRALLRVTPRRFRCWRMARLDPPWEGLP